MSHEILYTSAPRGLKPGTSGFCTVVCTRGIPTPLVDKLESLSGYRAVFAPDDPNVSLNPVVYSHVRLSAAGKLVNVLSRVCDAGLDYSKRSNKFAHHLALEPTELPAAGPGWVLTQPGFMESSWDGQARILESGRKPPSGDATPQIARRWKNLTGDAGWAGVLAQAFLDDPDRSAYVIFDLGTDPLPLLAESLALLPRERRWQPTFSTYFTGIPQGITCGWRCVLRDSEEAKRARRTKDALLISLTEPLGQAEWSPMVELARTGFLPKQTATPDQLVAREILERSDAPDEGPWADKSEILFAEAIANNAKPTRPSAPPVSTKDSSSLIPPPLEFAEYTSSDELVANATRKRWPWVVGGILAAILVLSAVGLGFLFNSAGLPDLPFRWTSPRNSAGPQLKRNHPDTERVPEIASSAETPIESAELRPNQETHSGRAQDPQTAISSDSASDSAHNGQVNQAGRPSDDTELEKGSASELANRSPEPRVPRAAATSRPLSQRALENAPLPAGNYSDFSGPKPTGTIVKQVGKIIDATIHGSEGFQGVNRLSAAKDPQDADRWQVIEEGKGVVAWFSSATGDLEFSFSQKDRDKEAHQLLRDCILELRTEQDVHCFVLREQLHTECLSLRPQGNAKTNYLWHVSDRNTKSTREGQPHHPLFLQNATLHRGQDAPQSPEDTSPNPRDVGFPLLPKELDDIEITSKDQVYLQLSLQPIPKSSDEMLKAEIVPGLQTLSNNRNQWYETVSKQNPAILEEIKKRVPLAQVQQKLRQEVKRLSDLLEQEKKTEAGSKAKRDDLQDRLHQAENNSDSFEKYRKAQLIEDYFKQVGQLAVSIDVCYEIGGATVVAARLSN